MGDLPFVVGDSSEWRNGEWRIIRTADVLLFSLVGCVWVVLTSLLPLIWGCWDAWGSCSSFLSFPFGLNYLMQLNGCSHAAPACAVFPINRNRPIISSMGSWRFVVLICFFNTMWLWIWFSWVNCHGFVILHRSREIICLRFLKLLFPVRIQDMAFMSWPWKLQLEFPLSLPVCMCFHAFQLGWASCAIF